MSIKRQISKSKQIAFPSLAEVRRAVRAEAERAGDELGLRSEGMQRSRPLEPGRWLNDVVCWLLRQPVATRNRIAVEGHAIMARHLASAEAIPVAVSTDRGDPGGSVPGEGAGYYHPRPLGPPSTDHPGRKRERRTAGADAAPAPAAADRPVARSKR